MGEWPAYPDDGYRGLYESLRERHNTLVNEFHAVLANRAADRATARAEGVEAAARVADKHCALNSAAAVNAYEAGDDEAGDDASSAANEDAEVAAAIRALLTPSPAPV